MDRAAPAHAGPLGSVLQILAAKLSARALVLYVPELTGTGWEVVRSEWVGRASESGQLLLQNHVRAHGAGGEPFGSFDPHFVCESARNTVVVASPPPAPPSSPARQSLRASLELTHCHQMRALLCEGPHLLAWIGALREAPFALQDQAALQQAIDPLRRVLEIERHTLEPIRARAMVEAVLDVFDQPAFLLSQHGRIEHGNRAGQHWLAADAALRVRALRDAGRGGVGHPTLQVQALLDGYQLVRVLEPERERELVLRRASSRWPVREPDLRILGHVLQGCSNKEIASAARCSEVTVERRLTNLYRLAGVQSRAQLIASLLALR